jgi:phage virion morphogenesis protein
MTGASMRVSLEGDDIQAMAAGLVRLGADMRPLMRMIGVGLVEETHRRFERAQDPQGRAWAPLSAAYLETKRGPGPLRELGMRGGLMGSITFAADTRSVRVGSNKVYAAVHQFGATIKPVHAPALRFRLGNRLVFAKRVTIPARPYLGFGIAERLVVREALDLELQRALGRG